MNSNGLKYLFKVVLNVNLNASRPALVSAALLHNKISTNYICRKNHSSSNFVNDLPFFENVKQKIRLQLRKIKLRTSGFYLYECIADQLNYAEFFEAFEMQDTFNSWFLVTELHVWMLMTRLMADPQVGRSVRNNVVEALWKDVAVRSKKLGLEHATVINAQIKELSEEFQAALVNYDEGILSDDTVLAGAVWRRFFNRECTVHQLEGMVKYIRQSMFLLDKLGSQEILIEKRIKWLKVNEVLKTLPP